ncbi:Vacuolar protein-sorting-associated protein 46 AltName: Full=Charged multivesicular body protein 1; AltName: Full=Doa4-independent degradation protein 2 [Serendipita indica DSM 11827]|nr:Vacuolar protein-sorting-associated protein 46 AltName: Full=Charged multivesicular body protein 1; AltName: Full=Doa4-independent degradation protein 2 [Serendipita indica DSM 11827]
MSNLEKTLFQLKFTAKMLSKQSSKALKDEKTEKARLKKALTQGNTDGARIYAANAIRKKNEALNLLRLASRIDAVASRVETAVTMKSVTGNMTSVVRGMDRAMESMNLERISLVMDKFESQFADLDVQTSYMEDTMQSTTAVTTPQDQIDELMRQTAEEANIELQHNLGEHSAKLPEPGIGESKVREESGDLAERLRALRPAS